MTPSSLKERLEVLRVLPRWWSKGIGFIHVPKNAGVSISTALYGKKLPHVRARDIATLINVPTFGIVREPYDRFLSAYNFVWQGGSTAAVPNEETLEAVRRYSTIEAFISGWLVHADYMKMDVVFHRQVDFLCNDSGDVGVDHIFRYDELGTVVFDHVRKFGYGGSELPQRNKTTNRRFTALTKKERSLLDAFYARDMELSQQLKS